MKHFLLLIAIAIAGGLEAQINKVSLEASGLTCSMCSNAINKALKTLDFVRTVSADVKNYTFELSFVPNSQVDFGKIRKKVEDAGSSVSGFYATIYFDKVGVSEDQPVMVGNSSLLFVNTKSRQLDGEIRIKIIDKGFITTKELRNDNYRVLPGHEGVYHVTL